MSLSINTNAAALAAYQSLAANVARLDDLYSQAAVAPSGADSVSLTHSSDVAAANSAAASPAITDSDLAFQVMQMTLSQMTANPSAAVAAQANSAPDSVLSLLQ